jgi:hypothetical protein
VFQPGTRRSGRLIGFPNAHISDFRSRAKRRGMPLPRAQCLRWRERGSPPRQNVKAGCQPRASLEGGQSPPSQWRTASPSRPTARANPLAAHIRRRSKQQWHREGTPSLPPLSHPSRIAPTGPHGRAPLDRSSGGTAPILCATPRCPPSGRPRSLSGASWGAR